MAAFIGVYSQSVGLSSFFFFLLVDGWRQQLIRRKRGKWPIGDARSVDPIRPPVCADRLVSHAVAAAGAASSPCEPPQPTPAKFQIQLPSQERIKSKIKETIPLEPPTKSLSLSLAILDNLFYSQ